MAAIVDASKAPYSHPPLPTPTATPEPPNKRPSSILSDQDKPSEDGSCGTTSLRQNQSDSLSLSDPAVEEVEEDEEDIPRQPEHEPHEQHETEDTDKDKDKDVAVTGQRSRSSTIRSTQGSDGVRRLSAHEMQRLANSPESLPIAPAPQRRSIDHDVVAKFAEQREAIRQLMLKHPELQRPEPSRPSDAANENRGAPRRPSHAPRTVSTPPSNRRRRSDMTAPSSPRRYSCNPASRVPTMNLHPGDVGASTATSKTIARGPASAPTSLPAPPPPTTTTTTEPADSSGLRPPSPVPPIIPLPPMSLPTHLQLELAAQRPSPLYIHQSYTYDMPYESNAVKFQRLKNVLLLPSYLERTLHFGALACLDAWLHNFTILPIRFLLALGILGKWWGYVIGKETRWLVGFVWYGLGRLWERGRSGRIQGASDVSEDERSRSQSRPRGHSDDTAQRPVRNVQVDMRGQANGRSNPAIPGQTRTSRSGRFGHRRTKSMPSNLSAFHKADILQGLVIICSSMALMTLDASRMYHFIRGQSAIKLYVIYNILEVGDRLLSAIGQDILECLFSTETLSRNASGRSKVLMPMGMFLLALSYNCLHSIALYYQVITLNVAVNAYSNALLTLLLSNQFVEIKSTVFKRFEKDNLFQLTCADIVERFQLWIMLLIIGMRNVIEVGGLSVPGTSPFSSDEDSSSTAPVHHPSILPHSFTVLPSWLMSGEVLSPFFIVIGSEMLVDTIKHAYVSKFNNIKPTFYSRTLDILCKDYYTNAFVTPSLTRRLGLAVIPLSCLFIRASVQTYHMFLSTHLPMPMPMPQSTQTSLSEESAVPSSPAVIAALNRFDTLIRDSLGRATYGYHPYDSPLNSRPWYSWTSDDFIAAITMIVVFFIAFLVLLILKLLLGMVLLKYSRNRYAKMKHKEHLVASGKMERESYEGEGKRVGGYGHVEVTEDKQRWVHADKTEGLKGGKGPGGTRRGGEDKKKAEGDYSGVFRYEMVTKRIW